MKMVRIVASVGMLAVMLAACGGDDEPSGPSGNAGLTVTASAANIFSPATLDITVGQTVTWSFGAVDHNVIFNPVTGAPQDIAITRNGSVSRTFNVAGTFPYVCTLHAAMTGTIRVTAGS
jgi:plastocyanin